MSNQVQYVRRGRQQFAGAFEDTWLIKVIIDPPSISSNSSHTEVISIPGLTMYSIVLGISSNASWQQLSRYAHVEAPGQLHLEVQNTSGGPVDLPEVIMYIFLGTPVIDI